MCLNTQHASHVNKNSQLSRISPSIARISFSRSEDWKIRKGAKNQYGSNNCYTDGSWHFRTLPCPLSRSRWNYPSSAWMAALVKHHYRRHTLTMKCQLSILVKVQPQPSEPDGSAERKRKRGKRWRKWEEERKKARQLLHVKINNSPSASSSEKLSCQRRLSSAWRTEGSRPAWKRDSLDIWKQAHGCWVVTHKKKKRILKQKLLVLC